MGLLGTFWGLLQTIGAVGKVVGSIDVESNNFEGHGQLRVGLDALLSGMATAFSSSLFGLTGSLILGFLDLQLGQAMGRFFNELEDWLSAFARFNDSSPSSSIGSSAIASGMSEEGRAVLSLSQSISDGEDNRARLLDQVSKLSSTMAKLNEGTADDQRIRDHLAQLNANILQLSEDLRADRSRQIDILASEIRGLSSLIAG